MEKQTLSAQAFVIDFELTQVRALRLSDVHEIRITAAEREITLEAELKRLKNSNSHDAAK